MFAVNQPEVMIGKAHERFDESGNLKDEITKKLIRELLRNHVALSRFTDNPTELDSHVVEKGKPLVTSST